MKLLFYLIAALILSNIPAPVAAEPLARKELLVFAASSLSEVLPEAAGLWPDSSTVRVAFSFDASSRLARQIEEGAPADVFVSADEAWMDHVSSAGSLAPRTRADVAGNRLVLIVPVSSTVTINGAADLMRAGGRRLALAGENVPAGRYARAALESLKVWPAVEGKIVRGDNVRVALRWVASGEADAGVVYATDARGESRVRTAFVFPDESHPPIVYPAAALKASKSPEAAARFVAFLRGPVARGVLERYGFAALNPSPSPVRRGPKGR